MSPPPTRLFGAVGGGGSRCSLSPTSLDIPSYILQEAGTTPLNLEVVSDMAGKETPSFGLPAGLQLELRMWVRGGEIVGATELLLFVSILWPFAQECSRVSDK